MSPAHSVFVTVHHDPARLGFLAQVLDAIAGWPDCTTDVSLVTNSPALAEEEVVRAYEREFEAAGSALRCVVASDLAHPYHLTWHHKRFIPGWRRSAGDGDLFIYLEDDIVLDAAALAYFRELRPRLDPFGLIPSYLRYERSAGGELVAADLVRPDFYGHRNTLEVEGLTAHVPRNPYWAGYILDRVLAAEYEGSASFDIDASRFVGWDLRARAAMGPCFENVPAGFSARNAVVLEGGRPRPGALVWHCADNYAGSGNPFFGRLPIAEAFVTGSAPAYWRDRARGWAQGRRVAAYQRALGG